MIRCLVQREMMHEKGFIYNPPLQQLLLRLKHTNYAGLQGHLPHGKCASNVGAPPKMVMGSIPTGDAVTGPHIRGTLSMREMSLQSSIIGMLQPQ